MAIYDHFYRFPKTRAIGYDVATAIGLDLSDSSRDYSNLSSAFVCKTLLYKLHDDGDLITYYNGIYNDLALPLSIAIKHGIVFVDESSNVDENIYTIFHSKCINMEVMLLYYDRKLIWKPDGEVDKSTVCGVDVSYLRPVKVYIIPDMAAVKSASKNV